MFKWISNLFKPESILVEGFDIAKLNREINNQIRYTEDLNGDKLETGRKIRSGDCEDIAGCKYLHLKDQGIDSGPLLVKLPNGRWHCVLVVKNYVLDNRTNRVYNYWKLEKESGYVKYNPKNLNEQIAQLKYNHLFEQLL